MNEQEIEKDFRLRVGEQVNPLGEGYNRYRVFTPFMFPDGDHLSIVLKQLGQRWILSDEGHTLMRLTYEIDARDLIRGNCQKLIESALKSFGVSAQRGRRTLYSGAQWVLWRCAV